MIFGAVVIIYTSFGGFSAVAITDTIQGIIMCIGTFLFIFFVLKAGGGLAGIDAGLAKNLPGVYDDLFSVYTPGTLLSSGFLSVLVRSDFRRLLSARWALRTRRAFIPLCG